MSSVKNVVWACSAVVATITGSLFFIPMNDNPSSAIHMDTNPSKNEFLLKADIAQPLPDWAAGIPEAIRGEKKVVINYRLNFDIVVVEAYLDSTYSEAPFKVVVTVEESNSAHVAFPAFSRNYSDISLLVQGLWLLNDSLLQAGATRLEAGILPN